MKFIFADCESTGRDRNNDDIIQLSAMSTDENFKILDVVSKYCLTPRTITKGAYQVHKINNYILCAMSKNRTFEEVFWDDFRETFYSNEPQVLVAHNAGFDRDMIINNCKRYGLPTPEFEEVIDTMTLFKHVIYPDGRYNPSLKELVDYCKKFKNMKDKHISSAIEIIVEKYGKNITMRGSELSAHDSLYDIICMYLAMRLMYNDIDR